MSTEALFHKLRTTQICSSTGEWLNTLQCIPATNGTAQSGKKAQTAPKPRANPKITTLSEGSQTQKST